MDALQTLVLGIVQGVGEFLPISSSANLDVISKMFSFGEFDFRMKITLHAGSLIVLVVYFRKTLWDILLGLFTKKVKLAQTKFSTIVLATIPVVIIGAVSHNFIKNFNSPVISGLMLIIFGIILWLSDTVSNSKFIQRCTKSAYMRDLLIGVIQSLAFIPGVSRLGICTTAYRLFGVNRKQALSNSLLLAIPTIAGVLCIELFSAFNSNTQLSFDKSHILGIAISGVIGVIALPICVKYMEKRGFFGIMCYRIVLGLITIFLL